MVTNQPVARFMAHLCDCFGHYSLSSMMPAIFSRIDFSFGVAIGMFNRNQPKHNPIQSEICAESKQKRCHRKQKGSKMFCATKEKKEKNQRKMRKIWRKHFYPIFKQNLMLKRPNLFHDGISIRFSFHFSNRNCQLTHPSFS